MPSAAVNTMAMVGPSLRNRCTAIPIATSAASIGTIKVGDMREGLGGVTVACGSSSRSGGSAMLHTSAIGGIPDQTRIEGLRCEHRQDDDGHEEHDAKTRLDGHERRQLYERD